MSNKQLITFGFISIILLVGIFFVGILNYLDGFSQAIQQELPIAQNNIALDGTKPDLLITPASKLYKSMIEENDPIRGNKDVELVILEFGDFECLYCGQLYPELIKILVEFDGQVQLVWKDFPIPSHLQARVAALAARCAKEQGKFWEYHDYLFENQEDLSRELYNQIALELNLDLVKFNGCLNNQEKIEEIGQGLADGQSLGVDATPYLFIGNRSFDYALSYEELKKVIEEEMNQ